MSLPLRQFVALPLLALVLVGAAASITASTARADGGYPDGARGYDISYPQCPSRVPPGAFGFAIVGVNNGRTMTENPCLPAQVTWARKGQYPPSFYINTNSPPDSYSTPACAAGDGNCRAFQYGGEAARYALASANRYAPEVSRFWLDVETANRWSADKQQNAAVLRGMIDVLEAAGKVVGIYSTSYQFGLIAGSFSPGLDTWVPRPEAKRETAADYCRRTPSFGGGRLVMLQLWYTFDENYVCPSPGAPAPPPALASLQPGDTAIVSAGGECLNLRSGAGITFSVRTCLPDGTRVTVTGEPTASGQYTWVPITSAAGVSGWAAADYLSAVSIPSSPSPPPIINRIVIAHLAGD